MKQLIRGLHDIWCAVSHRCRVSAHDDPLLKTLQQHEQAALQEAATLRRQREATGNFLRDYYTGDWEGNRDV